MYYILYNRQWVDFPGMKEERSYFRSMFVANNSLFAVGGDGAENSFESIDFMNAREWRKEKDLLVVSLYQFILVSHCITILLYIL